MSAARRPRTAALSDAALPELSGHVPPWPGAVEGEVFVRRGPEAGPGAERALMVHGLGGSAHNWTDLQALLGGRLATEAIDLPGFGHSPPPSGGYGVRAHARAVVRHLEARGGEPVHLLGNSLGGAVSVLVAARRPDLVRTLTLVSPALPTLRRPRGSDPRLPLLLLPGAKGLAARQLRSLTPDQRVRGVVDLIFADPSLVSDERRAEMVQEAARRAALAHDQEAFAGSLRGLVASYAHRGEHAVWRRLAQVQAPSLVLWGDRDRLVSVGLAVRTARVLPDARLLVLPGVGHVAQMERPDLVARAVLALADERAAEPDRLQGCSLLPHE